MQSPFHVQTTRRIVHGSSWRTEVTIGPMEFIYGSLALQSPRFSAAIEILLCTVRLIRCDFPGIADSLISFETEQSFVRTYLSGRPGTRYKPENPGHALLIIQIIYCTLIEPDIKQRCCMTVNALETQMLP